MILTAVEYDDDGPTEVSLQTVTLARDVARQTEVPLHGAVFGEPESDVAADLGPHGVETVHVIDGEALFPYAPEVWASGLTTVLDDADPPATALLAPGTDRGQEILAHIAAERDHPMAANCFEVDVGDPYEVTRQRWGGSLHEVARLAGEPKLMTVPPHELEIRPAETATDPGIVRHTPTVEDPLKLVRVAREEAADIEGVPLGEARVVVGGGRGVGGPDGYAVLEELADLLGGTVGASRAAINEGWRPHDDQIGLTGAKISPELYIACGISGAVQHMVGCKGAKHILAINTDPEAAIMQKADYAIIGDLHEVIPAIIEAVEAAK